MKKILALIMLALPALVLAQEIGNYLVMNDIGEYKFRPKRVVTIGNAGVLVPTGHFPGHGDMTYEGIYIHPQTYLGVEVKITQHVGSDSDKWLLHEVDKEFRTYYGVPDPSYIVRTVDGNTILTFGAGGWDYRWLSGNKVIMIEYQDSQLTKPEPLEIVKTYLAKHPSSLSPISLAQLRSAENKTKWIKDEMDRRLWLCDKWEAEFQLGKVQQKDMLQEQVKSMEVFLNYREKYYGMKAADEKNLLNGYLSQNNKTAIKNKLDEYKQWWSANKTKAISL